MALWEVWVSFKMTFESCVIVHSWWFIWDWQNNKRSAKAVECSSFESFIRQGTHEDLCKGKMNSRCYEKLNFPLSYWNISSNILGKLEMWWTNTVHIEAWDVVWCKLLGRQEESKTLHNQPTREEEIVTLLLHKSNKKNSTTCLISWMTTKLHDKF